MRAGRESKSPLHRFLILVVSTTLAGPLASAYAGVGEDAPVVPQGERGRIEPSVALNPVDPAVVLVAATDGNVDPNGARPGAYLSTDGGQTFHTTGFMPLPPGAVHSGDVSITYDHRGRAFYAYVGVANGVVERAGGVLLARSRDGGLTWSRRAYMVSSHKIGRTRCQFQDWPSVAADPKRRRLYVVWHRTIESGEDCGEIHGSRVMISRSDDLGRSFTRPLRVSGRKLQDDFATSVAVDAEGAVYVSYRRTLDSERDCPTGDIAIFVARSTDGARSFSRDKVADETCGGQSPNMTGAPNMYGTATSIAVSPLDGAAVVAWHDHDAPGQVLHFRISSDRGRTWQPSVLGNRLTDVLEAPRVAFGPDGRLYVHFIRDNPGGTFDSMLASSSDDGQSWSTPARMSNESSNRLGYDTGTLGENIGLAVGTDGVAHAVWTDVRNAPEQPNIWANRFTP
jgi:hypothetical protein